MSAPMMTEAELLLILQEARYGTDCPVSGDFDAAVRDAILAGYRAGLRDAASPPVGLKHDAHRIRENIAEAQRLGITRLELSFTLAEAAEFASWLDSAPKMARHDIRALLVEADEYIDRLLEADPSAPAYPHEGEELHARIATALADSAPKERKHG